MIARIWHGTASVENAEEYLDYLNKTGIPDYRKTDGNLGAFVLRNIESEKAHFLTLSFWDSLDSIKLFAGEEYRKARYYPEDAKFLIATDSDVQHYELFGEAV